MKNNRNNHHSKASKVKNVIIRETSQNILSFLLTIFFLLYFRRAFHCFHHELYWRGIFGHQLYKSILASIMGRNSKSLQEYGAVGVLLLQIQASWLSIRSLVSWMSCVVWWRIQTHSGEVDAWMADGRAALCILDTYFSHFRSTRNSFLAFTMSPRMDLAIWTSDINDCVGLERLLRYTFH